MSAGLDSASSTVASVGEVESHVGAILQRVQDLGLGQKQPEMLQVRFFCILAGGPYCMGRRQVAVQPACPLACPPCCVIGGALLPLFQTVPQGGPWQPRSISALAAHTRLRRLLAAPHCRDGCCCRPCPFIAASCQLFVPLAAMPAIEPSPPGTPGARSPPTLHAAPHGPLPLQAINDFHGQVADVTQNLQVAVDDVRLYVLDKMQALEDRWQPLADKLDIM